jgi:hypothetical protein
MSKFLFFLVIFSKIVGVHLTAPPSEVPTFIPTADPTFTPTANPTFTPIPTTISPSFVPSAKPTITPSAMPTFIPSASPSFVPSRDPSVTPTTAPTREPTARPTAVPTAVPSIQPSGQPSSQPSGQPSGQPISRPTSNPTSQPSCKPSRQPTTQPSISPTSQPTGRPSDQPSSQPTSLPSVQPSAQPTMYPSSQPSSQPSQPSSQPSSFPTDQPTSQPSTFPTAQPSSAPSCQPSSQPTSYPTVQPSEQPTSFPSSQPTSRPSSQPSEQPSASPSGQPTAQPTSAPSSQPTGQPLSPPTGSPSTQPSSVPSCQPSSLPTIQPTGQPSASPTDQPTTQPSRSPSSQPSTQPSSQPTNPTTQPTGQPSLQPFGVPSSQPSGQPSTAPSSVPDCPAGAMYVFTGDGGHQCVTCQGGTFSKSPKSHFCSICPAGYFSKDGATSCSICPLNQYSVNNGSSSCAHCPASYVNGKEGSFSKKDCVNPTINFVSAGFALGFCGFVIFLYLLFGRLQKVAFQRRWRLTVKSLKMFAAMITTADLVTISCHLIDYFIYKDKDETLGGKLQRTCVKPFLLYFLILIVIPLVVISTILQSILKSLFTTMVLWRAYNYVQASAFTKSIISFLNLIDKQFFGSFQFFYYLSFPFVKVIDVFQSIKIDLPAVNVSCLGAQTPLFLLADLVVLFIVVVIIEADYQMLWSTMILPAMGKIRTIVFSRYYFARNPVSTLLYFSLSFLVSCFPEPSKVIQYALGWVSVLVFFEYYGRATSNLNCDGAVPGVPLDSLFAILTTICAYALIFPAVYLVSEVLVPSTKQKTSAVSPEVAMESGNTSPSDPMECRQNVSDYRLEKKADSWTTVQLLRLVSMFSSVDWLYYRILYFFGNSVLSRQRDFLLKPYEVTTYVSHEKHKYNAIQTTAKENQKMIQTSEDVFTMDDDLIRIRSEVLSARSVPKVPILDALESDDNIETINERREEKEAWTEVEINLPTFTKMADKVQKELKFRKNYQLLVGSELLCWFFPVQLCTEIGREIWYKVGRSYLAMVLASLGIWFDWVAEDFDLDGKFKYQKEIEHSTYGEEFENWQNKNADLFVIIENDERLKNAQIISATVTTRIALIQLIPFLTLGSTVLTDLSSCPLFVCKAVNDQLPKLIVLDAVQQAIGYLKTESLGRDKEGKETLQLDDNCSFCYLLFRSIKALNPIKIAATDGKEDGKKIWFALFLTVYIFITRSRLIDFVVKLFLGSISVAITFYPEMLPYTVPAMTIILTIQGLIYGIYYSILLQRLLFHRNGFKNDDDADPSAPSSPISPSSVSQSRKTEPMVDPANSNTNSDDGSSPRIGLPAEGKDDEHLHIDFPTSDGFLSPRRTFASPNPKNSSHVVSGMFWTPEKESWLLPQSPGHSSLYSPDLHRRAPLEVERNQNTSNTKVAKYRPLQTFQL